MRRRRTPDPKALKDIIRRIVKAARPEKFILFGSAARGQMGPNSDLDLLVVKRGRFDRGRVIEAIDMNLHWAGAPLDCIFVTPEDLERYRDTHCLVIAPALREGKVVYAR